MRDEEKPATVLSLENVHGLEKRVKNLSKENCRLADRVELLEGIEVGTIQKMNAELILKIKQMEDRSGPSGCNDATLIAALQQTKDKLKKRVSSLVEKNKIMRCWIDANTKSQKILDEQSGQEVDKLKGHVSSLRIDLRVGGERVEEVQGELAKSQAEAGLLRGERSDL